MKKEKREKGKAHVRSNFKNTSNHQNIHVPLNSEEYLGMNKKISGKLHCCYDKAINLR